MKAEINIDIQELAKEITQEDIKGQIYTLKSPVFMVTIQLHRAYKP